MVQNDVLMIPSVHFLHIFAIFFSTNSNFDGRKKIKKKKEKIKPFFDFLSLQVVILSDVLGGKGHRKSM